MTSKSDKAATRPRHHANDEGNLFQNPWPSAGKLSWSEVLQSSFPLSWYKPSPHLDRDIKVIQPDWGVSSLAEQTLTGSRNKCVIGTWLGHAGSFVEFPSLLSSADEGRGRNSKSTYLVFDPVFSDRVGPAPALSLNRLRPNPCSISVLPGCDAVFISHNHYDHLDLPTITEILKRWPQTRWYVGLGIKAWLVETGVKKELVHEMDWWESREGGLGNEDESRFKVSCVPAQHNSGRYGWDTGTTLWCGWIVERFATSTTTESKSGKNMKVRTGSVYHAGDTGYRRTVKSEITCPVFREIGAKFGPLDLSFIPIWRGGSLSFISYVGLQLSHQDISTVHHCSPYDALNIHRDVQSRNSVAIHFGTFVGSENESLEAVMELDEARRESGIGSLTDYSFNDGKGRAGVLDLGGSIAVKVSD